MKHLSLPRLIAITLLGFALTVLSNTIEPAVLGHKVLQLVPDRRNTALGFTTFAGLIVAVLVQPIVGMLSDRTRSRWGRRLPYMAVGTLLVLLCLYLIATAPIFGLVVAGILLLQLASNTVQGPWQALIPDQVPQEQRGRAAGIKAMFDILGFVVGRQVAGQLISRYADWGETAVLATVSVPAALFLSALVITAIYAREKPEHVIEPPHTNLRETLRTTFLVDLHAHPAFLWWFINRMLFWSAFIGINTFLLFYLMDVVDMPEASAQRFVGQLSMIVGGTLALVSIPAGWAADKLGRRRILTGAGVVAAAGTLVLLLARDVPMLIVSGILLGTGVGVFISANWALITDIVPAAEAARYLGIANIATAGGSALARFLGAALIDALNAGLQSMVMGYVVMYGIAGLFFLGSIAALIPLTHDGSRARLPRQGNI